MKLADVTEVKHAVQCSADPCISIYVARREKNGGETPAGLQLRALARETERKLAQRGLSPDSIAKLTAPLYDLAIQYHWPREANGLAVFRSMRLLRRHPLAFASPEIVFVGENFYLEPLICSIDAKLPFYVLTFDQKEAKLLEARGDGISIVHDVSLPEGPGRADITNRRDRFHRWLSRSFGIRRQRRAHEEKLTQQLLAWFRQIDQVVTTRFSPEHPPVVLTAAQRLCKMYRHVSRYPSLAEAEIHGRAERTAGLVWERARHLATPRLQTKRERHLNECLRLWCTPRASNELSVIEAAARQGRIAVLFLSDRCWQTLTQSRRAHGSASPDPIELAALNTFVTGGIVHCLPSEQMPGGTAAAAVFRY